MKKTLSFLLLIFISNSIFGQTVIKGNISTMGEWSSEIYLLAIKNYKHLHTATDINNIASTLVDAEGNFKFTLDKLPCAGCLYRLDIRPKHAQGAYLIVGNRKENFALFELKENQELHITANADRFSESFQITNNETNWNHSKLRALREPMYAASESFSKYFSNPEDWKHINLDSIREVAISTAKAVLEGYNKELRNFIDRSDRVYDKIYGLLWLDYALDDLEYYESVLQELKDKFAVHPFVLQLEYNVRMASVLSIGKIAPNLVLPDSNGILVELYGCGPNLVLIDFWASWCAPCRTENRNTVKPLYEKDMEKGFAVYSASIDEKREAWLRAINADGMTWFNVSNLEGSEYDVHKAYQVESVPATFLIDMKDKKILAKNLRGEDLTRFVKNYYSGN